MTKKIDPDFEKECGDDQNLKKELANLQNKLSIVDHFLMNSDILVWIVDTNLDFIFLSPAFVERYYKLTGTQLELHKNALDSFSGEYKTTWANRLNQVLSGESLQFDEIIGREEGDKYFNLNISPYKNDGQIAGAQVVIKEITGLRNAEKNEFTNLKKFREIFNQIQDLYYEVNLNGKITELSPAIKNFSSYKREDLIGKDVALLYQDESDREILLNTIKQKGVIKDYVINLKDKDDSTKKISVNANLVYDDNGNPLKVVGIIRDITEIEQKNKDLRWLRRAIEHSPMSIVITDINGTIEYVNPFFSKATGYSKEEAISQKPSILKSGKQPNSFYKNMWDTILSGTIWEGEFFNKRKDGSLFIERAIISPVKDREGNIVNFIALKEDITQTKETLNEINRLKLLNNRIINTMREGIVVIDQSEKITFTNPSFLLMTGYTHQELTEKNWNVFIDKEFHQSSFEQVLPSQVIDSKESKLTCKDGSTIPVIINGSPIFDGRKYMGEIAVFTDITSLKENEKKLKDALEKAQLSDKLKTSFLANMSHEIRTPMNAILGFSEILRSEKDMEEDVREEYFSIIEQKGNELLQIISNVIDISKIEAKIINIYNEEVNVNLLIERIFKSFKKELKIRGKHEIQFFKQIPTDSDDLRITTDINRLNQVILNLLENASKFTKQGSITFGYLIYENELEFLVKDTGIGISLSDQKIIFDRFRQVDDNYTRQFGGTGLGLNICKELIEMMGGHLRVESEVGKGSTFYFTLPKKKD